MSPKPSTSHSTAKSSVSVYKETLASLRPPIASMLNLLTKSSTARRSSSSISNNTALPTSDGQSTTIPTSQAYADLVSLSKLCSAHITALGIALKPKADHAAAKAMLDKWLVELNKMDLLVSVWISTCQNGVWDKEVRWAVLGLVESFESLHATLSSATSTRQQLLSATGQVWSANTSLSEHTSPDVQSAYARALLNTQDTIKDAHAELRDLIDSDATKDDEDLDGGDSPNTNNAALTASDLDDLTLNLAGPSAPLEEQDAERVKALSMVIRLSRLLHKRTGDWTLKYAGGQVASDDVLDQLYLKGEDLAAAVDDVVAAAQEPEGLASLLDELKDSCRSIADLPVLTLSASEPRQDQEEKDTEERKWRAMAWAQIDKAVRQIQGTL